MTITSLIAMALGAVTNGLLSRSFPQELIGRYSVFTATGNLSFVCAVWSYAAELPNVRDDSALIASLGALLWLSALTACVVFGCAWLAGYEFALPLALATFMNGVLQICEGANVRDQRYRAMLWPRIAPQCSFALVVLLLRQQLSVRDAASLVWGQIAAYAFVTLVYGALIFQRYPLREALLAGPTRLRELLVTLPRYVTQQTPSVLMSVLTTYGPVMLIGRYIGLVTAAQYNMAIRFSFAPIQSVGSAVGSVVHGQLARAAHEDPARARVLLRSLVMWLALLGLCTALGTVLLGPRMLGWVLGPGWRAAGLYVQLLAPFFGLTLAVEPFTKIFLVLRRQDYLLLQQSCLLGASCVSFGIAVVRHDLTTGLGLFSALASAVLLMTWLAAVRSARALVVTPLETT